jgi:hypothetical protein
MLENLEELIAESAIRRLIGAYCDAVNRLDADAAARLFAPDARVRIAHYPELTGQEAIGVGLRQIFATAGFLHQRCDIGLIDVVGGRANARLSVFEVHRGVQEPDLSLVFGIYEDEYMRIDERWRFHRRHYSLHYRAWTAVTSAEELPAPALQMIFAV